MLRPRNTQCALGVVVIELEVVASWRKTRNKTRGGDEESMCYPALRALSSQHSAYVTRIRVSEKNASSEFQITARCYLHGNELLREAPGAQLSARLNKTLAW